MTKTGKLNNPHSILQQNKHTAHTTFRNFHHLELVGPS